MQNGWNGSYRRALLDGSAWEREDCLRVKHGGSWDYVPWNLRAAFRFKANSGYWDEAIGFRVARTITP